VLYYGSEIGFMAGTSEHEGNRNYFGEEGIAAARDHPIANALRHIAHIRQQSIALQKGLQVNLDFSGHQAAFLRVYQVGDQAQTALVLLNKGDQPEHFTVNRLLNSGSWRELGGDLVVEVAAGKPRIEVQVPAQGVRVLLFEGPVNNAALAERLEALRIPANDD
jgi:cyclomaltodextrin glucanotransferase